MLACCRHHRRRRARGISILEVVVALAVITTVVVLIAPVLAGMTRRNGENSTREQEKAIHQAIFGDPGRGVFGFIGDLGRLPTSLTELEDRGTLPAFHTSSGGVPHVANVGYGWNGPYLSGVFSNSDLATDPWGQAYSFSTSGANAGRVISGGPDGAIGTSDDISYPSSAPPTTGTLFVTITANGIANPFGAAAKVYYPVDGNQTVTPTQKFDPNDPNAHFDGFAFTVPPGVRAVVVSHTGQGGGGGGCSTVSRTIPVNMSAGRTVLLTGVLKTSAVVSVTGGYGCTIPD